MRLSAKKTLTTALIAAVVIFTLSSLAAAVQPKLSVEGVMKGSLKDSRPYDLIGAFKIEWETYTITGTKGQLNMENERLVVTENAYLEQGGDNPLQLIADYLEMESASEKMVARGNVSVTVSDLKVKSDDLVGGRRERMQEAIAGATQDLSAAVREELSAWLSEAAADDQVFMLSGNVDGENPSIAFKGQMLLINAATETFIFAGPTEIEYIQSEEEQASETTSGAEG